MIEIYIYIYTYTYKTLSGHVAFLARSSAQARLRPGPEHTQKSRAAETAKLPQPSVCLGCLDLTESFWQPSTETDFGPTVSTLSSPSACYRRAAQRAKCQRIHFGSPSNHSVVQRQAAGRCVQAQESLEGKTESSHQGKRDCHEQKGARAFAALATALARRKHDDVERGSTSDFGCRNSCSIGNGMRGALLVSIIDISATAGATNVAVLVGSDSATQLCKI